MALSTLSPPPQPPFATHSSAATSALLPKLHHLTASTLFPANNHNNSLSTTPTPAALHKWRANVSFFTGLLNNNKTKNAEAIKQELLEAIAPLDRGAEATPEDQEIIDQGNLGSRCRAQDNSCVSTMSSSFFSSSRSRDQERLFSLLEEYIARYLSSKWGDSV